MRGPLGGGWERRKVKGLKWGARRPPHSTVLMAAVIVAVDVLFFQNRFWERLMVNVGIVLVFAAFYFRFLRRP